jgi:FixJ family two-component response regulator
MEMLNVTVVENDRWTRRALGRLLSQADLSVTTHASLEDADEPVADVIVAGASTIRDHLSRLTDPTPFVLITDGDTCLDIAKIPNCQTVPKPIRVSTLLSAIAAAAKSI